MSRVKYRISARLEFSPEAEKLYREAKNKSEFILNAIEFYATFGKTIQNELQEVKRMIPDEDIREIKQLLYEIRDKGVFTQTPGGAERLERPEEYRDQNDGMSDEERQMQEGIMSTLGAFLGRGDLD